MRTEQLDRSADVLCPFYKWHERQRINCEGMDRNATFGQQFRANVLRERYMLEKCADEYRACPIYEMLIDRKYPEARE